MRSVYQKRPSGKVKVRPARLPAAIVYEFFVPGVPAPKGSFRGIWSETAQRAIFKNDNAGTKVFQASVAQMAFIAIRQIKAPPRHAGRVELDLAFYAPRPASAPADAEPHEYKPDADKLARTVLDGLTDIVYVDDKQVARFSAEKFFEDRPRMVGARVKVTLW